MAPAGLRDTTQSRFGNRTPSRDPDCVSARDAATYSAPHRGAGLILQGAGGVEPRSSAAWHEPVGFALHHLMALAAQGHQGRTWRGPDGVLRGTWAVPAKRPAPRTAQPARLHGHDAQVASRAMARRLTRQRKHPSAPHLEQSDALLARISRSLYQRRKPGHEIQWLQHDVPGAVAARGPGNYNLGLSVPGRDFSSINDCIHAWASNSALAAATTSTMVPLAPTTGSPRST